MIVWYCLEEIGQFHEGVDWLQNALDLDVHDWVKFQKVKTTIEHTEEEIINLVDMSGGAGTGKSYVIKSILQYTHEVSGHRSFVRVAALTENAASLFSGYWRKQSCVQSLW